MSVKVATKGNLKQTCTPSELVGKLFIATIPGNCSDRKGEGSSAPTPH